SRTEEIQTITTSVASGEKSRRQRKRGSRMCYTSKARTYKSCHRARGSTTKRSLCEGKPATNAATSERWRRSSCSSHAVRRWTARFEGPNEVNDKGVSYAAVTTRSFR